MYNSDALLNIVLTVLKLFVEFVQLLQNLYINVMGSVTIKT